MQIGYDNLSKRGFIHDQFHCIHSGQMCNLWSVSESRPISVNCVELCTHKPDYNNSESVDAMQPLSSKKMEAPD